MTRYTNSDNSGQASDEDKLAKAKKLGRRLDRAMRRPKKKEYTFAELRLFDFGRYLHDRYGRVLPDDEAGREDLHILLSIAAAACRPMESYCRQWAPYLSDGEVRLECDLAVRDQREYAYMNADQFAKLLGLTYEGRQRIKSWTIGAIDVDKAGRDRLSKQRKSANQKAARKAKKAAKPKPREQAVLEMVGDMDGGMCAAGDLYLKAKRHRLFRDLDPDSVPRTVLRIIRKLMDAGHLGGRYEYRPQEGGHEWFIWLETKTKETPVLQHDPEFVRCETPIFTGSNHRTKIDATYLDSLKHEVGIEVGIADDVERAGRLGAAVAHDLPPMPTETCIDAPRIINPSMLLPLGCGFRINDSDIPAWIIGGAAPAVPDNRHGTRG